MANAASRLSVTTLRQQHTSSGDGANAHLWSSSRFEGDSGALSGYTVAQGMFVPLTMPSQPMVESMHRPGSGVPVMLDLTLTDKLQLWDSATYSAALDEMLANAQVESEEEVDQREHGHQDVMVMDLDLDGPLDEQSADLEHQMGNVLKKRRRKMNKHKHRKLLKKQRFLRRKLKSK
jgi:Mitochondrial mRNA-processing protein COX24, C-terminal